MNSLNDKLIEELKTIEYNNIIPLVEKKTAPSFEELKILYNDNKIKTPIKKDNKLDLNIWNLVFITSTLKIPNTYLFNNSNIVKNITIPIGTNILFPTSLNELRKRFCIKKNAKNIDTAFPNHENQYKNWSTHLNRSV